jgi:hypothetical protein
MPDYGLRTGTALKSLGRKHIPPRVSAIRKKHFYHLELTITVSRNIIANLSNLSIIANLSNCGRIRPQMSSSSVVATRAHNRERHAPSEGREKGAPFVFVSFQTGEDVSVSHFASNREKN